MGGRRSPSRFLQCPRRVARHDSRATVNAPERSGGGASLSRSDRPLGPHPVDATVRTQLGGYPPARRIVVVAVVAYALITGALLGAGWLVMEFGIDSWFGQVDQGITKWFAGNRTDLLDTVTANISHLADTFTVFGMAFGTGIVLLVLRYWRQAVVLLVALPLELAVFLSVVRLVGRPRPAVVPLDSVPATASFPSGHVAAAIALYGAVAVIVRSLSLSSRVNRWAVVGAIVIVIGVGLSRVYRGLHHPSDIAAGAVLGLAALATAVLAARTVEEK